MPSRNKPPPLLPTPRTKSPTTPAAAVDYVEAVQTLNESTLKQACEWLLMDDDDMDDSEQANDEKILEAYYKCESALQIIQKHEVAPSSSTASALPLMLGAPNLSMLNGSQSQQLQQQLQQPQQSQAQQRPLSKFSAVGGVIAKGGVLPMRRTAMPKPGARLRAESITSSSDIQEGGVHSSLTSSQPPLSKKARVGAPSSSSNSSTSTDNPRAPVSRPPPSALTFLAKLNKDNGNNNGSNSGNGKAAPIPANTITTNTKCNPQRPMHRRSSS